MDKNEIEKRKQEILKQQEALDKELKDLLDEKSKQDDLSFKDFFLSYRMYFFVGLLLIAFLLIGFGISSFAKVSTKSNMILIVLGGLLFLLLIICWPIVNFVANKSKKEDK